MSMVLMRRSLDCWKPGLHTGTFRGNQLAFVAATAALQLWKEATFSNRVQESSLLAEEFLQSRIKPLHASMEIRGVGLIWGIDLSRVGSSELTKKISKRCFEMGLIVERCGRDDTTLKILPPLNIPEEHLRTGLAILEDAIACELRFTRGNEGISQ
jgi:diaminobutyrate-2-oxoglutarate transaminase